MTLSMILPYTTSPHLARSGFVRVALLLLGLRALAAALLPITGDEAYFVTWAARPDRGYYDHPPMVGWWLWALSQWSLHPFVLRLPALIVPVLVALMTASVLSRFDRVLAWRAATLVLLVPLNAWNVAITTDVPLMFFSMAALATYLRASRTAHAIDWLMCGILLSGALLSKYFAGLLVLGLGLHAIARPGAGRGRGFALAMFACLPAVALHLEWNWRHCWPNLMFNLVNRHEGAGWSWQTPLLYVATVFYVLTPAVAWFVGRQPLALRPDAAAAGPAREAPGLVTGVAFGIFALVAAVRTVGLHWLASFVAPAVMWFAVSVPAPRLARAVRFALVFALMHWIAIALLALVPLSRFEGGPWHHGLVMTLRPEALNARLAPYLDRYLIAAPGYSPAATIGFNLGRPVIVFGPGAAGARQDDLLTDFRGLDGRDLLIVLETPPDPADYLPYFERIEVREAVVLGATFRLVLGHGFRYPAYRDAVLDEIRRRWYAVPGWLPGGPCYFCDRYFPERDCHR